MPRTARCGTSRPSARPDATWRIGLLHAAIAIPGRTDHDEVVVTVDEIAASGLDYLALGHWHAAQVAKAHGVTYAYAGAPEPVAVDQDRAGKVLLVTLEQRAEIRTVTVEERVVGRTTFERLEIDAADGRVAARPDREAPRGGRHGPRARRAPDRRAPR